MMGYIANTRTQVYHSLDCPYKPVDNSKVILNPQGYTPCAKCCPKGDGDDA